MKSARYALGCLLCWSLMVSGAQAATLYMDPQTLELDRGDTATIGLRLDVDDEQCVNVVDGTIHYSDNIEIIDISRGNSIFTLWVEEPVVDKQNRTVTFAGGIPNGYCGRVPGDPRLTNNIIDIVVMSPGLSIGTTQSGNSAELRFGEETRVLLNDGYGTEAARHMFGTEITLSPNPGSRSDDAWLASVNSDVMPPESFTIHLDKLENVFNNKHFISFNTTDKQSGLSYYEVMEEPLEEQALFRWGAAEAPWVRASSPYVLEDQSLNSTIRVRAVDKAGNEYVAVLIPDEANRTMSSKMMIIYSAMAFAAAILLGVVISAIIWYRRRTRPTESDDDDEIDMIKL